MDKVAAADDDDVRKARRRAYVGSSGREPSASALKRQSVMTLGSIQQLQHRFARHGLAGRPQHHRSGRPLPLALPGQLPRTTEDDDELEDLPRPPSPPAAVQQTSFDVEVPTLRSQREQLIAAIADLCERWSLLDLDGSDNKGDISDASKLSIPLLLDSSARTVRIAQKYFVSLPAELVAPPGEAERTSAAEKRRAVRPEGLGVITSARPIPKHTSMAASPARLPSNAKSHEAGSGADTTSPSSRFRANSLAVLGMLRDLEVRYRLSDADMFPPESSADISRSSSSMSSATNASSVSVDQSYSTPDSSMSGSVIGNSSGFLYRRDVSLRDLREEATIMREWLSSVNDLLATESRSLKTARPGSSASSPRSTTKWLQQADDGDTLAGACTCLRAHLPAELLSIAFNASDSSLSDRGSILKALSDGQLLCIGYNAVLRASHRPWGFISDRKIHNLRDMDAATTVILSDSSADLASDMKDAEVPAAPSSAALGKTSSQQGRIGRTFRRHENLRLLVGALKVRYRLFKDCEVDVRRIARKEAGWEGELERLINAWITAVASEEHEENDDIS